MSLHFLLGGRVSLLDLPYETRRIANLLSRNGADAVFGVRIRLEPLGNMYELEFQSDELGGPLEIIDVPPLQASLGPGTPIVDLFEAQQFRRQAKMPLALNRRRHEQAMETCTGPDRGPASLLGLFPSI